MFQNHFSPLVITSVVVITLSGCQSTPAPTTVVEEYFKALQTMDVDSAYELLSEDYQVKIGGKPGLQMAMGMMYSFSMAQGDSINAQKIIDIKQEKIDGKTVKVIALIQKAKGEQEKADFILVKEENKWKINDSGDSKSSNVQSEDALPIKEQSQKEPSFLEKVFSGFNSDSQRLFPIIENDKKGYIDSKGNVVISPQFDFSVSAMDFSPPEYYIYELYEDNSFKENLISVGVERRYGYVNKQGKYIINPQFDSAQSFSEGLAAVSVGDRVGYINTKGEFAIQAQFEWADSFSEGLARINKGTKYGYIDKQGKIVIEPKFDLPQTDGAPSFEFSEGLAIAFSNNKYGYINQKGEYVIEPQFEWAYPFSEGLAVVGVGDRKGYINTKGEFVIEPQFDLASSFSEGLAVVNIGFDPDSPNQPGKYGYIDKKGQYVINPQFDRAREFSEGIAAVKVGNKWGYIDKKGNYLIEPQFEDAGDFVGELAAVGLSSIRQGTGWKIQYGYVNKKGEIVWRGEFITEF